MIESIWNHITSIVIGIRFLPNLGFQERIGSLFDEILYEDKSFFDKEFFKRIEAGNQERVVGGTKRLITEETGDELKINNQNVIFTYYSTEIDEINHVIERFREEILYEKLYSFNLTRIQRIGLIYRYELDDEILSKNFIEKNSFYDDTQVKDLQLRFNKKIMTSSVAKEDENDYQNAIYTIGKESDSARIHINIDYQHHFDPLISDTKMIDFKRFKKKLDKYNQQDVKEWLNKNYVGDEKKVATT